MHESLNAYATTYNTQKTVLVRILECDIVIILHFYTLYGTAYSGTVSCII